jgi:hypothetical protein
MTRAQQLAAEAGHKAIVAAINMQKGQAVVKRYSTMAARRSGVRLAIESSRGQACV